MEKRISLLVVNVMVFVVFFLTSYVGLVSADPVSFETAQYVAEKWMERVGETKTIKEGIVLQEGDEKIGYLFNFSGGGFVVVPTDNTFEPIKAWSRDGFFQRKSNFGMDMKTLIEEDLLRQRGSIKISVRKTCSVANSGWGKILSENLPQQVNTQTVGPLLTTKWGQGEPYSMYCPVDVNSGKISVTGCTNTAMAQILRYWQWPKSGVGSKCYTFCPDYDCFNNQEIQVCADFEHSYDWGKMPDVLSSSSSQEEKDAVARLMSDLGVLFETTYSSTGSGAFPWEEDLPTHFGYSDELKTVYEYRSDFFSTVKDQLDKKYPVFFCSNAHAYVADGYRVDLGMNQTHFNFGWGGGSDGWYTLEKLDDFWSSSSVKGDKVTMIINIHPDTGDLQQPLEPPELVVTTSGRELVCSWSAVANADNYLFSFTPIPYKGPSSIGTLHMKSQTSLVVDLWVGASYFVAVQSCNESGCSSFSNVGEFKID